MSDIPDPTEEKDEKDDKGIKLPNIDISELGGEIAAASVGAALARGGNPGQAAAMGAAGSVGPALRETLTDVAKVGAGIAAAYLGVKALEGLGEITGETAGSAANAALSAAFSGGSPGRMVGAAAASTAAQLVTKSVLQKAITLVKPKPEEPEKPPPKESKTGADKKEARPAALAAVEQSPIRVGFRVSTEKELIPVARMAGDEALSRPFSFDITLALPPAAAVHGRCRRLLLEKAELVIEGPAATRTIHGIVLEVDLEAVEGEHALVRVRLVPPLMKLSLNRRLRIFQDQTTPQIVEAVLHENGITNADWSKLKEEYPPRNYCVQYRESDLEFVSRLLEEEGIFFFSDCDERKEGKLIFADHWQVHGPIPGNPKVAFSTDLRATMQTEVVRGLVLNQRVRPRKVTLRDFAYRNPQHDLAADALASGKDGAGEFYDYPGEFVDEPSQLGERLARVRMQELEVSRVMGTAISNATRFLPGRTFVLGGTLSGERHPCEDLNQEYLVVGVHHNAALNGPYGTPTGYTYNTVLAVCPAWHTTPATQTSSERTRLFYRPPRVTPRPVVVGLHTATVVAPPGEEIHTDCDGRVQVRFAWHRDADSCWIRVAQPWAGAGFGTFFLPRAGEEVVVAFLEGDPDRPLIVGRVHNRTQPPGHDLPEHKAWSYIRTQSTPGGVGYNEILFQDEKEQEQISVHAERDLQVQVNHDERINVDNVYKLVAGQRIELIVGNSKLVVTPDGISINGKKIEAVAEQDHVIHGELVKINC